jgi:hypothetical protein
MVWPRGRNCPACGYETVQNLGVVGIRHDGSGERHELGVMVELIGANRVVLVHEVSAGGSTFVVLPQYRRKGLVSGSAAV